LFGFSRCGRSCSREFFQAIRCRKAGADVVHQNSVFAKFICQTFHQADYGRAYCVREYKIGYGLLGGNRSQSDDASPFFPLHVRNDFAGEVNGAEKVQIDGALPFVEAGGKKSFGGRATGVGDANVDRAKLLRDRGYEAADGSRVGDIEGFGEDVHFILRPDLPGGRLQCFRIAGAHRDAATFRRKSLRGGAANSLTGGGNQGDTIVQAKIHQ
jgi:hypothetical protein